MRVKIHSYRRAQLGSSSSQQPPLANRRSAAQHQGHRAAFLAAMPVTMATPGSTPRGGDKVKEAWTAFMDAAEVGPSILAHA